MTWMLERHHLRSPPSPPPPTLSLPHACLPPALCSAGTGASPGEKVSTVKHSCCAQMRQDNRPPRGGNCSAEWEETRGWAAKRLFSGRGRRGRVFEAIFGGCDVNKRGEDGREVPRCFFTTTLENRKDTCDQRCTTVWRARRSPVWFYFVHQHENPPENTHTHTREKWRRGGNMLLSGSNSFGKMNDGKQSN